MSREMGDGVMPRFKRKPIEVDAWKASLDSDKPDWIEYVNRGYHWHNNRELLVKPVGGGCAVYSAKEGCWVIHDGSDRLKVLSPEDFAAEYDPVERSDG